MVLEFRFLEFRILQMALINVGVVFFFKLFDFLFLLLFKLFLHGILVGYEECGKFNHSP